MAAADLLWKGDDSSDPNDVNIAANWESLTSGETDRVPTAGDSIFFRGEYNNDCTESLSTLAAVALAGVTIEKIYTGKIGVSGTNEYLQLLCSGVVDIGSYKGTGSPSGSGLVMLDLGTTETDIIVHDTGSPTASNTQAVRLLAVNAANTLTVKKGSVSVAAYPGEVSTFGTITIDYVTNRKSDANVVIGEDVTLTTLNKIGGVCYLASAATTVTQSDGTLYTSGTGAITTLNVSGGNTYPESSGTITNVNLTGGVTDASRSSVERTFTNVTVSPSATYTRDNSVITETNGIETTSGIITITGA